MADAAIEAAEVSSEEETEVKKAKRKKKKRRAKKKDGTGADSDEEMFESELAAFMERLEDSKPEFPDKLVPNLSSDWIEKHSQMVKLDRMQREVENLPTPETTEATSNPSESPSKKKKRAKK